MNLLMQSRCPECGHKTHVGTDYALFKHLCQLHNVSPLWERIDKAVRYNELKQNTVRSVQIF